MIIYSSISHQSEVLVEHSITTGNFASIAQAILESVPPGNSQLSYVYDTYFFHYIKQNELVYLCLCKDSYPRRRAFSFLRQLQQDFPLHPTPFDFTGRLVELMALSAKPDAFQEVQDQVDSVRQVMTLNIEKVLERGDRIEQLVDRTHELTQQSALFRRQSKAVKRSLWFKNYKLNVMVGVAVIALVYFGVGMGCGLPSWSQCLS